MAALKRFLFGTDGATAVEYAVMLALILMVTISAVAAVGVQTSNLYGTSNTKMSAAGLGS